MSDPYQEVSRRQGGHGFSPLAWFGIVVAGFFLVGIVGTVGVGLFVANKAQEIVHELEHELTEERIEVVADVLADLEDLDIAAEVLAELDEIEVVAQERRDGVLQFRVGEQDELVTLDLADISSAVREGAALAEELSFQGSTDESGGVLKIQTQNGETVVELRGGDEGGFLSINTPNDEFRFGAGDGADPVPSWVPMYPGAQVQKRVFSGSSEEGSFGGVVFQVDGDPSDVLKWYTDRLGSDARDGSLESHIELDGEEYKATLEWITSDGDDRRVTVVTGEDDDGTPFAFVFHKGR